MNRGAVLCLIALGGCHLIFPHAPSEGPRSEARPPELRLELGANDLGALEARPPDSRGSERPADLPIAPDLGLATSWVRVGTDAPPANLADVTGVAVDAKSGDVIAVGWFYTDLVINASVLKATGSSAEDIFVARFSQDGTLLWAKSYGGVDKETPRAVVVDATGRIVIAGSFTGTSPIGGTSKGMNDAFLLALDGSGNVLWSKRFGGTGEDSAQGLALVGTTLYLAGFVSGAYELEGVTSPPTTGTTSLFLGALTPGGGPAAPPFAVHATLGGTDPLDVVHGYAVAADSAQVCVTGDFLGKVMGKVSSSQDVLTACYDSGFGQRWIKGWGSTISDVGLAIAIDADDVWITGRAGGATDFGCGALGGSASTPFLARLTRDGVCRWSKSYGGAGSSAGQALVSLGQGVLLAGDVSGPFSFLSALLPALGSSDAVAIRLDENATQTPVYVWGERLGGTLTNVAFARAAAVDLPRRNVYVGGGFNGALGAGVPLSNGQDAFLFRRSFNP